MYAIFVYNHDCLISSQDEQSPNTTALSELKAILKNIVPKLASAGVAKQLPLCTTSYLISCDVSTGLQWEKMTAEQTLHQSSCFHTETLTFEVLKKVHCMLSCMPWPEQ